jgi:hypothetical protein
VAQPQPAPGGAGAKPAGKKLPAWAWGVAIVLGLVVGYYLTKPKAAGGAAGGQPTSGQQAASAPEGASSAVPLDLLEAMGLRPSSAVPGPSGGTSSWGGSGVGGGGSGAFGSSSVAQGDVSGESVSTLGNEAPPVLDAEQNWAAAGLPSGAEWQGSGQIAYNSALEASPVIATDYGPALPKTAPTSTQVAV